jgi:hypothetical protein
MWKFFPCGFPADASLMGDGREGQDGKGQKDPCRSTRCTIDSSSSVYQQIYSKKMKARDRKL